MVKIKYPTTTRVHSYTLPGPYIELKSEFRNKLVEFGYIDTFSLFP